VYATISPSKMRGPALIIGSAICLCVLVLVVAKDIGENDDVRLKVSIRRDNLKRVSSCQHTFSQVELLNLVSRIPVATLLALLFQSSWDMRHVRRLFVVKCHVTGRKFPKIQGQRKFVDNDTPVFSSLRVVQLCFLLCIHHSMPPKQ
jgi:hypothetical protein